MSSDEPITKQQLVLAAIVILTVDFFILKAPVELLGLLDFSPTLHWAIIGTMIAAQVCVLLWIRHPAPLVLSKHRENLFVWLTGFVFFPAWSLAVVLSIALNSTFPDFVEILFLFCMLSAGCVMPLAVFLDFLHRYRIPYYAARCTKCLYDLTAVEADTCPECNTPITRPEDLTTLSSHPAHSQAAQDTDQAEPP